MKIKREMDKNKNYTVISIYVIITCIIIYCLSLLANNMGGVLAEVTTKVGWVIKVLKPVVYAFVFAYIMHPAVLWIEKKLSKMKFFQEKEHKCRTASVFIMFIIVVIVLVAIFSVLVFSVTKQLRVANIDDLINVANQYMKSFNDFYASVESSIEAINFESVEIKKYISDASSYVLGFVQRFMSNIVGSVTNISSFVATLAFSLVLGLYMLIDEKILRAYVFKVTYALANRKVNKILRTIVADFDYCFSGYLKGQLMDAFVMAILISVTLSIVGVKFAMIIGILAGIGNLIPYCGPIIAYAGTALVCLVNGEMKKLVIGIILLVIIQGIDGNIIGPKLLGMSVRIHPILIIISLIVGAAVGGLLGMLLAVPCGALVKIWFGRFIDMQIAKKDVENELIDEEDNADVAD